LKATMETWRRFWCLRGSERAVVLEAAAALGITWIGLRLAGFRCWKKIAERFARMVAPKPPWSGDAKDTAEREIARMASAAAHYLPFRTNCLEQSLVLWWLLRRRGIPADLKIGAKKEANRFEAHAWVEFDGGVIGSPGEEHIHFVPFSGSVNSMETQSR
jgi:hypothetical protein